MQMRYAVVLFLLLSYCFGPAGAAQGQQTPVGNARSESSRRIVRKTVPVYPAVAKRINLGGTVKVVAVVSADGKVESVEPVGGSPILLKAAEDAIAQWQFAAGGESKETVELRFKP